MLPPIERSLSLHATDRGQTRGVGRVHPDQAGQGSGQAGVLRLPDRAPGAG